MEIKQKNNRDSNVELLRILTMFMIMFHHFTVHSGFVFKDTVISGSKLWISLLTMGGKLGVNIFVLISGYYLISSTSLKPNFKKILRFWGQVFFYSFSMTLVYLLMGKGALGIKEIVYSFAPIAANNWWFVSTYFVLYLIHPYINRMLQNINKKEHLSLIVFLVGIWTIMPLITKDLYQSNELIWFIMLYIIAAYIRLYDINKKIKRKHYILASIFLIILVYGLCVSMIFLGTKNQFIAERIYRFYEMRRPEILLLSITIFMSFIKTDIPYNRFINKIASTTFGIYLIHDHYLYRNIWWESLLNSKKYLYRASIIPYSLFAVVSLFILCSIIELIRQKTIEKLYLKLISPVVCKIENIYK